MNLSAFVITRLYQQQCTHTALTLVLPLASCHSEAINKENGLTTRDRASASPAAALAPRGTSNKTARSSPLGRNICSGTTKQPRHGCNLYLPFFLVSSAGISDFFLTVTTLPSMTAVLPSRNAMRDRPSQFLKESTTSGCCGRKTISAISLDLSECGLSIFLPPVSLPTLKLKAVARHAERPQRTKPMGE